jgi:hypothetical protein
MDTIQDGKLMIPVEYDEIATAGRACIGRLMGKIDNHPYLYDDSILLRKPTIRKLIMDEVNGLVDEVLYCAGADEMQRNYLRKVRR